MAVRRQPLQGARKSRAWLQRAWRQQELLDERCPPSLDERQVWQQLLRLLLRERRRRGRRRALRRRTWQKREVRRGIRGQCTLSPRFPSVPGPTRDGHRRKSVCTSDQTQTWHHCPSLTQGQVRRTLVAAAARRSWASLVNPFGAVVAIEGASSERDLIKLRHFWSCLKN